MTTISLLLCIFQCEILKEIWRGIFKHVMCYPGMQVVIHTSNSVLEYNLFIVLSKFNCIKSFEVHLIF